MEKLRIVPAADQTKFQLFLFDELEFRAKLSGGGWWQWWWQQCGCSVGGGWWQWWWWLVEVVMVVGVGSGGGGWWQWWW